MRKISVILILIFSCYLQISCDVDAALLQGEKVEYNFPPGDSSDQFYVDADKIFQIPLLSKSDKENDIEAAMISSLYVGDTSLISADTVFLYLHGNSGSLNGYWEPIRQMANIGGHHRYGVFAIDYRGFGNSEGKSTSIESMRQDLYAALDFLESKGLNGDRLIVYGLSLGSLPGCQEAGDQMGSLKIEKLIIEAPQTTADVFFQDAVGISVPSSMVTDYNFDLVERISQYKKSLLWMHGVNDEIALFENAQEIYDAHQPDTMNGEFKQAHILPLGGHYFRWDFGYENWGKAILDFIVN
jgi:hypothetical protein